VERTLRGKGIYIAYIAYMCGVYMVSAMVELTEHANWVLNVVKAKYKLRTKSEAINKAMEEYEEQLLDRPFKPEFVKEVKRRLKEGKYRRIDNVKELFE